MKSFLVIVSSLILFTPTCWAEDAIFNKEINQLHIPFVLYRKQYYQADLSFIPPAQLKLESVTPLTDQTPSEPVVPVYEDLSFHLSSVAVGSTVYAANLSYIGDNVFQIDNLFESSNVPEGNTTFQSQHFSGSGLCVLCHNDLEDDKGKDVSIVSAWESTMMANSTRDPFWQAKVRSELNQTPSQQDIINDTCTRCHAPMANEEARKQNDSIQTVFDQGLLNKQNPYHDLSMNGVSCTLCHQISPEGDFGTDAGYSGNFSITSYPTRVERLIYGPYGDVFTTPMQNFVKFTPVFSEHIKSSELCASCHDLTTPYTDDQGIFLSQSVADEFPEQMVYSEWLNSDFSDTVSCQQCHMKHSNGVTLPIVNTQRDYFAQHSFLGSNRLMLSILQNYREQLGVIAEDFSANILNAEQLLQGSAELHINAISLQDKLLSFNLNIHSETGHKLPSGYPSRRIIVHVTVRDQEENVVFETGKVNSDGSVEELDSDLNLDQYEPHYQLIDSATQVQVYETVMQDYQDNITFTLLRAKSYRKDNRLLPKGFDKQTAPNKVRVQGLAAFDENFTGGSDTLQFTIDDLTDTQYSIEAELIYQTLGYAFAQDLFKDNAFEISRFKKMFDASNLKSTSMIKVQSSITR